MKRAALVLILAASLLAQSPTGLPSLGVSGGIAYAAQVSATVTGAVSTTTLTTCPANASKFCMYLLASETQCTDLTHLAATGTVALAFAWVDGSGSAGSTSPASTILSSCAVQAVQARMASVGPGQVLSYSINAGTGTYSLDYGISVIRTQ